MKKGKLVAATKTSIGLPGSPIRQTVELSATKNVPIDLARPRSLASWRDEPGMLGLREQYVDALSVYLDSLAEQLED